MHQTPTAQTGQVQHMQHNHIEQADTSGKPSELQTVLKIIKTWLQVTGDVKHPRLELKRNYLLD